MKMIHKYSLGFDMHHNAVHEIEMPRAAKILDVQMEFCNSIDGVGYRTVIWAIVNPKKEKRKYVFQIFGTGFEMSDYDKKHYDYVGTVPQNTNFGNLFWHIFEVHE